MSSAGAGRVRIAVFGDVHDDWILEEDSKALHFLKPDLVLFTGDYGNENVQLVKSISDLQYPKAAILGIMIADALINFQRRRQIASDCSRKGSAKKIYNAATGAPEENPVILLAHNGPTGLGSRVDDICGQDWVAAGGDHGDPDLERAISYLQSETGVPILLVAHAQEPSLREGLQEDDCLQSQPDHISERSSSA